MLYYTYDDQDHSGQKGILSTQDTSLYDFTTFPGSMQRWIEKNSSDVVIVCNTAGNIKYISRSVEQLLNYHKEELEGSKWRKKVLKKDALHLMRQADSEDIYLKPHHIQVINKHGKYIWCEINVTKMEHSSDQTEFVVLLRDISNKKEAEEMMIRSEKMSIAGQLASGIAHEIRNPLTSIKGFLQLLEGGVNNQEQYYRIMYEEIDKMEEIASELLYISRPLTNHYQEESLKGMIEDVAVLLGPQARAYNCSIETDCHEAHYLLCDRSQIKQALINLVKNAYESMEYSGKITIKAEEGKNSFFIYIIDEGPGIPEEVIHKLDEPFFTTKESGTGLGLMITNQILEQHGGMMHIFQNEEKGSTFRITLPKNLP